MEHSAVHDRINAVRAKFPKGAAVEDRNGDAGIVICYDEHCGCVWVDGGGGEHMSYRPDELTVRKGTQAAHDSYRAELAERVRAAPLRGFDRVAADRYVALHRIADAETLDEAREIARAALQLTDDRQATIGGDR